MPPTSLWPLLWRSPLFWIGGGFMVGWLTVAASTARELYDDWRFPREAATTQGVILSKHLRTSYGSSGSSKTHYRATYRYTVQGRTLEGADELAREGWSALSEGGSAQVLYLPGDPAASRLAGPREWFVNALFTVLGVVLGFGGAVLFALAVRKARLEVRLREIGVRTRGRIVALAPRNLRINGVRQWRLQFEYRDQAGAVHAKTRNLPEPEAQQLKVGDAGDVLFDPGKPWAAVWIGAESIPAPARSLT